MIMSLRSMLRWLTFMALFLTLTCTLVYVLRVVGDWIFPIDKYREPLGHAVRVFQLQEGLHNQPFSFIQRLGLYYWLGE